MIHICVDQIEPGMILAAPVWHPCTAGHVLLNSGYRLDKNTISRLHRFDIEAVWIHHPGFDFLDQQFSNAIPQSRVKLYEGVKRNFTAIANKTAGAFDLTEYRTIIGNMIVAMVTDKNNAVWAERLMNGDSEMFAHCSNVAYLTLVIGMRIKEYIFSERKHVTRKDAEDLTNLGIGAMLHDLGKLSMDEKWHKIHCFQNEADDNEYRTHAERGYHAIQGRVEATISQIVLNHHQHFDGGGFPQMKSRHQERSVKSMKGRNIHIYCRIVAVANTLDGLIGAAKKRKLPLIAALVNLRQSPLVCMFDPVVLDAALRCIPPFPLGSVVELSDGRSAVVTGLNESNPCQPKVTLNEVTLNEFALNEVALNEVALNEVALLDSASRASGVPTTTESSLTELDLSQHPAVSIAKYEGQPVQQFFYTLAFKSAIQPQETAPDPESRILASAM